MTASPARCDAMSSCHTPPAGLTAAWKAMVAMRIATTIMESRFLVSHSIGGVGEGWLGLDRDWRSCLILVVVSSAPE